MTRSNWAVARLFTATAFVAASLLFLSEPMVGKLLLPRFGGSSSVWNTCMVFFQTLLLLGYVYAHWSLRALGSRRQLYVHGLVLLGSLLFLPVALPAWDDANSQQPLFRLLALLTAMVGIPFFVLATSGPLLQSWFSRTAHPRAQQPYFLYAAGNLGSFLALLAYPFVVEPLMQLTVQSGVWSAAYVCFVGLVLACMVVVRQQPQPAKAKTTPTDTAQPIRWQRRATWLFYAFVPSSLMLGVTTKVTVDVAAVPLLWIVPLALYLLTFVVAFAVAKPQRWARHAAPLAASGLAGALVLMILPLRLSNIVVMATHFGMFGLVALVAHMRLAATRPPAEHLTNFYIWVAIGGMLGGVGNSLLAPVIFNDVYEYPLMLVLAAISLVGWRILRKVTVSDGSVAVAYIQVYLLLWWLGAQGAISWAYVFAMTATYAAFRFKPKAISLALVPLLLVAVFFMTYESALLTKRTFYGVIKVRDTDGARVMLHGTTVHGSQSHDPAKAAQPTSYYHTRGPLGDVIAQCRTLGSCRTIASMGEGTGTIAAYGRPGDSMTFLEIDPAVHTIASDPKYFTYLANSKATTKTIIGDGRLSLQRSTQKYDLLIIDAFSSDAIPTHLLTRQAIQLYQQRLNDHGLLAIHISNRNVDLEPVLAAVAQDQNLTALRRLGLATPEDSNSKAAHWVVLAKHNTDIQPLSQKDWRPLAQKHLRVWTDDYSNITSLLR